MQQFQTNNNVHTVDIERMVQQAIDLRKQLELIYRTIGELVVLETMQKFNKERRDNDGTQSPSGSS